MKEGEGKVKDGYLAYALIYTLLMLLVSTGRVKVEFYRRREDNSDKDESVHG